MEKQLIRCADVGVPSTLLLHVPDGISVDGTETTCFAIPVKFRVGGILLCLPRGVVSEEALIQSLSGEDPYVMLGPSKLVEVPLIEEAEGGEVSTLPDPCHVYVVDFTDDVLGILSEYDGTTFDDPSPVSFSAMYPAALPETQALLTAVESWLAAQSSERVHFYSAREETENVPSPKASVKGAAASKKSPATAKRVTNAQVLESVAMLAEQVKLISDRQQALEQARSSGSAIPAADHPGGAGSMPFAGLPSVSASLMKSPGISLEGMPKAAQLIGKTKAPVEAFPGLTAPAEMPTSHLGPTGADMIGDGVASALVQQSSAITALIAHLTNQDPLTDLSLTGGSGTSSTSTKGSQRRERMQSELASGSSCFYLTMMQQVHRRLFPGKPVPRSETDLAAISFLTYLERTGGYKSSN